MDELAAAVEHAAMDCAALGRAWRCAAACEEVADRNPGPLGLRIVGLDAETLRACAAMLRARITEDLLSTGDPAGDLALARGRLGQ